MSEEEINLPQTPAELLAEMARMYNYNLSDFEAMMWAAQVFDVYPPDVVMRALIAHMESGTQDANFMPRYGAIKAKLEPVRGFKELEQAVRLTGPYSTPKIKDPILLAAIEQLGGWVRVCTEMPDPIARPIDFERYVKRAETALQLAKTQVQVQGYKPPKLKALASPVPSSAAPQLEGVVTQALPAPSNIKETESRSAIKVDLTRAPMRASIWR